MELTKLKVAQELGKQVYDREPLACPICDQWRGPRDPKQLMSSFGDMREELFCPHCDLTVELKVTNL